MKIEKLILENFRAFKGKIEIKLSNFNTFIGKNDQGKSSILEALDIFINEGKGPAKIEAEDLNVEEKNSGGDTFSIGVVFSEFPKEVIIDADNKTTLEGEFLLNSDDKLEVWKKFKNGKLKETSIKCKHPSNDDILRGLLKKKNNELKKIVEEKNLPCEDKRKSASLRKAIRESYDNLDFSELEIIVDAEDAKKIWEKLSAYLPVVALFHSDRKNQDNDSEIQDPLKITIEQIFKREDILNKLNEIAKEVEKEINSIATKTIDKFKEVSRQDTEIKPNIPEVTSLKWKDIYKNIAFNTDNNVPLNKRGSGFRRLMLLSFFLAEVEKHNHNKEQKIHTIYQIEEPETSLHPDLQKVLLDSLIELSQNDKYQILITTHSPQFIRLVDKDFIRYVENGKVEDYSENVLNKIIKNLGVLPNVGKVIWCVEGKNDEKFLRSINKHIHELKKIIDLEESINSAVLVFNLMNGSNLGDYIDRYITKNTNAIEFHLYDRDDNEKYKKEIEIVNNRQDGSKGLLTKKREIENYIPKELIEKEFKITINDVENWDDEDVSKIVAKKIGKCEKEAKRILNEKISKNITKEHLENSNSWDEVRGWFEEIKKMIDKVT